MPVTLLMRVRPKRPTLTRRPAARRAHVVAPPPSAPATPATPPEDADHREERRARASGGPIDRAQYHCACGFAFQADVSTSVACPHCGTHQAW